MGEPVGVGGGGVVVVAFFGWGAVGGLRFNRQKSHFLSLNWVVVCQFLLLVTVGMCPDAKNARFSGQMRPAVVPSL